MRRDPAPDPNGKTGHDIEVLALPERLDHVTQDHRGSL